MRALFASLVLCLSLWAHAAGPELPALTQPVIDQVGLFTEKQGQDLARDIRELSEQGGPQVGVLVVDNLQGYTIEDFSIRVAEAWKLGSEKKDDGVIILIAPNDRKIRIEVGGGVEGEITDLEASRWIRQVLRPAFKEQDYAGGVAAVLREIAAKFNVKLAGGPVARRVRRDREELSPASIIVLLILVFIVLPILNRGRGFRSFGGRGGYYGGGSGGGWSSGGGGSSWGGGGGGFSGGGASGDW